MRYVNDNLRALKGVVCAIVNRRSSHYGDSGEEWRHWQEPREPVVLAPRWQEAVGASATKNVAPRPRRLVKQRRQRWRPNKTVLATCGIERLALIMQRSTCSFSIFAVLHFLTGTAQQMLS